MVYGGDVGSSRLKTGDNDSDESAIVFDRSQPAAWGMGVKRDIHSSRRIPYKAFPSCGTRTGGA